MGVPSKVVGAGNNSVAANCFKIIFSEPTTAAPIITAWDDYSFSSNNHEIFKGTAGNGVIPMIAAIGTTNGAPVNSNWHPVSGSTSNVSPNLLNGTQEYNCILSNAAVVQNGFVTFNLGWKIPSDASIPADMVAVMVVSFLYTGAAPVLTWQFNDNAAGGTELTPIWTNIAPGSGGNTIKPADSGSTSSNVILHRPVSGVIDAAEIWVTA